MDTIKNHPTDELMASYSAASLPLSQALCISVHLENCAVCARKLRVLNQVGSELMHQLKPSPPDSSLKNQLLDRIASIDENGVEDRTSRGDASVPRCLHQFIKNGFSGCIVEPGFQRYSYF